MKLKIEEGEAGTYKDISVKLVEIVDAFYEKDGIHSSRTEYELEITNGKDITRKGGSYGSIFNIFGYKIAVKYCAVGTRDWKSFVECEIEKI
jgi:hypothetical protein